MSMYLGQNDELRQFEIIMGIIELRLTTFIIVKEDMCLITEFQFSFSLPELLCQVNTRFRSEFRYLKAVHLAYISTAETMLKHSSSTKSKQFLNLLDL